MPLFALSVPQAMFNIYEYAVPITLLAVLYGFRWKVGMWGNALSLGAVLFSALIAVGWWEDVAELLAKQVPMMLYLADCIAIWGLFLVSLLALDTATRFMSTVKVKFHEQVESVGNGIVLFLLFLALFQFQTLANGHFGMVGEHHTVTKSDVEKGGMTNATLGALRMLSAGNLSGFTQVNQFDDRGDLLELHLQRRQAIMLGWRGEEPVMRADDGLIEKMKRRQ